MAAGARMEELPVLVGCLETPAGHSVMEGRLAKPAGYSETAVVEGCLAKLAGYSETPMAEGCLARPAGCLKLEGPASAEMISRVAALMARVAEVMLWMAAQTVATRALWGIQCSRRQPTEHYCWIQWIGFLAHRNRCSRSRGGKC